MTTDVAHKSWWQIFEVVLGIPFLAAIALQSVVPLPLPRGFLAPAIVACHYALIAPEERYLLAKFGEEYARYAASVYRWLGRRR